MKAIIIAAFEVDVSDLKNAMPCIMRIPYTEYVGAYIMRDDAVDEEWIDAGKYLQEEFEKCAES